MEVGLAVHLPSQGLQRRSFGLVTVVCDGSAGREEIFLDGRHVATASGIAEVDRGDDGPSPYELILMALGSCTSLTLVNYARRKKWGLDQVAVRLHHARNYKADVADCGTRGIIDCVFRQIYLFGDLDDLRRARLLEVASFSPVYRALAGQIDIVTELPRA